MLTVKRLRTQSMAKLAPWAFGHPPPCAAQLPASAGNARDTMKALV
ncbi:hypothetical protein PSP20601_04991 [Pandoraea sputorum]|nr:hypothetical protein PSP20601_04991 [Pandoraea sputorum]